jgi:UDP-glucose 4-epimerase
MRVLVTGCAGSIGKYLVQNLIFDPKISAVFGADQSDSLKTLISSSDILRENEKFIPIGINLADKFEVNKLPLVDYVYHLAAINGTQNFYRIPWDVYFNSIETTINLIDYYKSKKIKRFVYTSSSEVYASLTDIGANKIPTDESAAVGFTNVMNPRWSYAGAKLSGEIALVAAAEQFGLNFSIIRYHNVYGRDMGLNHVIPDFIYRGKAGIFQLNGADNIRSFIFIDDAIRATILVAQSEKSINRIINIGSEETISMRDLGDKIMKIFGWTGTVVEFPAPDGSTINRCPDTSFLRDELGFKLIYSLDEGLAKLI